MKFIKYEIYEISNKEKNTAKALKNLNTKETFSKLNKSKIQEDNIGKFAVPNCIWQENLIIGQLSQTYNINLIKFKGTSKEEVPIKEEYANDSKTYFFIDCSQAQVYIQNRKYQAVELTPSLAIKRIQKVLNANLAPEGNEWILQKTDIKYDIKEVEKYFREGFVKSIEFHNIPNLKLEKGTKLHNPRIDLDEALVESWNQYSSETVDSVKITAKKDKSIAKNPIANIGIKLAEQNGGNEDKILKGVTIIEDGYEFTIKTKGNDYLVLPFSDNKKSSCQDNLKKILVYVLKRKL